MKAYKDIDSHIAAFAPDVQKKLQQIRLTIHKAAPDAIEAIKYGIPTFRLYDKNLVHFSGYATHIGFYPGSLAISTFKKELSGFALSKGTVRIPLDVKVPLALISKITKFRVAVERDNASVRFK